MSEQTILMFEMFTLIFVNVIVLIAGIAFFKTLKESNKISESEPLPELPPPPKDGAMTLSNSRTLMTLLQDIIKNFVAANFKAFLDDHNFEMTNKMTITKLIEETAKDVYKVISASKVINFIEEETLLSKEFYSEFIVILVTNYIKELVENNLS